MGLPEWLEVGAHGATVILAIWLGLTVGLRAPRRAGARAFGVLATLLVVWSLSIIVRRLTTDPGVDEVARWFEVAGSSLLPPAVLTVATALTVERRTPRWLAISLVGFWAVSIAVVVLTVVAPELEPRVAPPHLAFPGISGEVVGWAWIAFRVAIFAAAIVWVALAIRDVGHDRARRRQLQVTLLALVVGTIGGVLRIAPPFSDSDPWIGVSMVTLSVVLASYAVFAQGIFFAPEIAGRAFRLTALAGVGVTLYVGILLGLDSVARRVLAIDIPIVIGLALVATVAVFEPVAARVRRWLGAGGGDPSYDRMLRALGQGVLTTRRPEDSIEPALGQLARTMGLSGAEVRERTGKVLASSGTVGEAALELPLERAGTTYGSVAFGSKESGLPFTSSEREVLEMATGYLAASLELGARQVEQAQELERLSRERAVVSTSGRACTGPSPPHWTTRPEAGCTCSPSGHCARNATASSSASGVARRQELDRRRRYSPSSSTVASEASRRTRQLSSSGRTSTSTVPTSRSIARWADCVEPSSPDAASARARRPSASRTTDTASTPTLWPGPTWPPSSNALPMRVRRPTRPLPSPR